MHTQVVKRLQTKSVNVEGRGPEGEKDGWRERRKKRKSDRSSKWLTKRRKIDEEAVAVADSSDDCWENIFVDGEVNAAEDAPPLIEQRTDDLKGGKSV
jgi:hypothetical protein